MWDVLFGVVEGLSFRGLRQGVKFGVHGLAVALAQTGRHPLGGTLTLDFFTFISPFSTYTFNIQDPFLASLRDLFYR
jgi:hypothetical protein